MKKRYEELDSIRGIAALIVLIGHFSVIYPIYTHDFLHSSLGNEMSFLWNGHGSVIMFFVLSGFVLSLPFQERFDQIKYGRYLIKRICRIYIPYVVVISLAIGAQYLIQSFVHPTTTLVQWAQWKQSLSFHTILHHYLFLGEFNFSAIDMVIWSLVHEMRISLIFPILLFVLFKLRWKLNVMIALLFSLLSFVLIKFVPTTFNEPLSTNYFITFHYLSMFIVGALLARYKDSLINKMKQFRLKYPLLILALFLFNYPMIPLAVYVKVFGSPDYLLYTIAKDWLITMSAFYIILVTLSSNWISKLLLFKPIHSLGKVSYSLYLIHPIVLIIFAHIFYNKLPLLGLWAMAFLTTLLLSFISYKLIELPSIKLGHFIASFIHMRKRQGIMVEKAGGVNP